MHAAGVQLDIAWEDKPANFRRVRALAADLPKGSFLVLPEMFATGFSMNAAAIAEPPGGPTEAFLSELARERNLFVLGGVVAAQPDGRGQNVAAAFGPDGSPLARYAKIHPFSFAGEDKHYAPGSEIATFTAAEFTVAPFVCYDLRFPEAFRLAVRRGAQVYAVIANWPEPREAHWLALLKARAIENQAYVIGVNRCGRDPKLAYSGRSQILDPRGNVLADAGNGEGLVRADLDLAALTAYRADFPALRDMRLG